MHALTLALSLLALAAARDYPDSDWATHPDKTADWYAQHGEPLPDLAPAVTTVEPNKSYLVKLECLGCPFRVRELYQLLETWQDPPQDNSLLLNFTVDDAEPGLLLNGDRIAPLAPMPLGILAFQTPANLSEWTVGKMTSEHMLDRSWALGTKYGTFELQYEHAIVGVHGFQENWIQFDITGLHIRSMRNPGSYNLDKEGQQMVQLRLHEDDDTKQITIADIQVVAREDRLQPYRMKCGRFAIFRTSFNPLEWDYYGQFGTWTRTWHLLLWKMGHFVEANGVVLIIVATLSGAYAFVRRRNRPQQPKMAVPRIVVEDAETALLASDFEDSPPDYEDLPDLEDKDAMPQESSKTIS